MYVTLPKFESATQFCLTKYVMTNMKKGKFNRITFFCNAVLNYSFKKSNQTTVTVTLSLELQVSYRKKKSSNVLQSAGFSSCARGEKNGMRMLTTFD